MNPVDQLEQQFREKFFRNLSNAASVDEVALAIKALVNLVASTKETLARAIEIGNKNSVSQAQKLVESAYSQLASLLREVEAQSDKKLSKEIQAVRKEVEKLSAPDLTPIERRLTELENEQEETPQELRNKVVEAGLKKDDIEGLTDSLQYIEKLVLNSPKGGGGSVARGIQLYVDGGKKGISNTINLIPGVGVSLTYSKAGGRNDITINASSSAISVLTATGTIDESNTTFTFASQPTLLVINGASYGQTGGAITWTWNSGTLTATLSSPVGTGGSIFGL